MEPDARRITKPLGLQISLAHHEMLDTLVECREQRLAKKRFVVEDALELLHQKEIKPRLTSQ